MHTDEPSEGTRFLPAERTDPAVLAAQIARATGSPLVSALLEASGAAAAVLDAHRQVIAFNPDFLTATGIEDPARTLGLRPGEALGCVQVERAAGGCGTTDACPSCGAALAILSATRRERRTSAAARSRSPPAALASTGSSGRAPRRCGSRASPSCCSRSTT